jgi:alpha-L-rhamnosidase
MYAMLAEKPQGRLVSHRINPVRVMEKFTPVSQNRLPCGSAVYDMGQVFSGWVRISVRGEEGTRVTLHFGEQLKPDGRVNTLNLRTALARDIYILGGGNRMEEYAPRFTYHGFRYVEAEIEGNAEIISLTGEYVRNSVKLISAFDCSDSVLNRLHKNAVYTEGSNLHGVMTDCPQRDERFGWLNDLSSRIYQTVNNYEMPRVFEKVTADIADTQDDLGRIADTAPFFTGYRPADPVAVCYLLFGYKAYEYYGDSRILSENYGGYKKWVEFLRANTGEDGATLYSTYGDWCPPQKADAACAPVNHATPGGFVSIVNYYLHLRLLAETAGILGREEEERLYGALAESTRDSINKKYYDAERKMYATGGQSAAALALNCGLTERADGQYAARRLSEDIKCGGNHVIVGNQAYRHLFEALTVHGFADTVYDVLVNPDYPGWGYMVAMGATTVWERWEAEMQQKMHSFCHPMFASYDAWLLNDVCGIRPASGARGMDKLRVRPVVLKGLDYAEGSIELLRGRVAVSWKKQGERIVFDIEVPLNTSAILEIPDILTVNGRPYAGAFPEARGGGTYAVTAKNPFYAVQGKPFGKGLSSVPPRRNEYTEEAANK